MARPELECDLVMKGGITSGTVYPKAIARLAKDYRFRSIGGTSAGAIAAGAAAAAEYRRQTSAAKDDLAGFDELARLPGELGKPGARGTGPVLLELFRPQRRFRALFRFLLSLIGLDRTKEGGEKKTGKVATWLLVGRIAAKAILGFRLYALFGAAAVLLVLWFLGAGFDDWTRWPVIALIVFGGAAVAAAWGIWRAVQRLADNGFGLCRGFEKGVDGHPADPTQLTAWLHALIQRTAGRKAGDAPLTFGDLKAAGIDLRAMTTNLSFGLPLRLPMARDKGNAWGFFSEAEWAKYFPADVVAHLKARAPARATAPQNGEDRNYAEAVKRIGAQQHLLPLPEEEDFPVLVAVRMSLSFPVLLSAVPLFMLEGRNAGTRPARECWFSDGGISSNFPLHFFDSTIPGRPTFAINLLEVAADKMPPEKVYLAEENSDGLARNWKDLSAGDATAQLSAFLLAIFDVMQNWRDNSLLRLPGYRDRVAAVYLAPHEGGLNLNMPEPLIRELAARGEKAADALALHFLPGNAAECREKGIVTTWENHRWVRLLSTLAGMEQLAGEMKAVWAATPPGVTTYRDLLDPDVTPEPPSYKGFVEMQRRFALQALTDVEAAIKACREDASKQLPPFKDNAPKPLMRFRLTEEL